MRQLMKNDMNLNNESGTAVIIKYNIIARVLAFMFPLVFFLGVYLIRGLNVLNYYDFMLEKTTLVNPHIGYVVVWIGMLSCLYSIFFSIFDRGALLSFDNKNLIIKNRKKIDVNMINEKLIYFEGMNKNILCIRLKSGSVINFTTFFCNIKNNDEIIAKIQNEIITRKK
jgi:hypothetical protein